MKRHTNTQSVVGADLMFLDVATGFPGCMHDARVSHGWIRGDFIKIIRSN